MQNATTGLSLVSGFCFLLLTLHTSNLAQYYCKLCTVPTSVFVFLNYLLCTWLGVRHGSSELKQILIK